MNKYAIAFYDDKDNVEMEVRVDKTSGSVLETIEINKMELSGNQIVREI